MRRQSNTYTTADSSTQLLCTDNSGVGYAAIFPTEYYAAVRNRQWTYKGKNGIVDSFGLSLAGLFAEIYGYKAGTWKRIEANEDYSRNNYTIKESVVRAPANATVLDRTKLNGYYERVRWTSKYAYEVLNVTVLKYGRPSDMVVKVLINTYLRTCIPKYCLIKQVDYQTQNVDIMCTDGVYLRNKVLAKAMSTEVGDVKLSVSELVRPNLLDFRVDPNDNTFISTCTSHFRRHNVDEGVLIEVRDRTDRTSTEGWCSTASIEGVAAKYQFRLPITPTKYRDRVSFVLVQQEAADVINDIWYDSKSNEFIVDDLHTAKPRALKFLVCDVNSISYKDVYFAPRHTDAYETALKDQTKVKNKRVISKLENSIGSSTKAMFTKPRYIRRIRMKFNTVGFNDTIYGGVGVFYLDARPEALYRKSIEKNDPSLRKDTRGASSINDPTLPELAGSQQ